MLCCNRCFEEYSNNTNYEVVEIERKSVDEWACVCGPEEEFYGESCYAQCEVCNDKKMSGCPMHLHCVEIKKISLTKSANKS